MTDTDLKIAPVDASGWQKALDAFTRGTTNEPYAKGLYYNPNLHVNGEGGFFPPVTETNYETAIHTLFKQEPDKGQWFLDYLKNGKKENFDEHQQAFIDAYDRLMVGFLDSRTVQQNPEIRQTNILTSAHFSEVITRDETLTDAEYQTLLKNNGFGKSIEQMGPLGLKWIYLTGGIVQGAIDEELQKGKVRVYYDSKELKPFYTAAMLKELDQVNASHWIMQMQPDQRNLNGYVQLMNDSCSKDPGQSFTPGATPAHPIPENEIDYGR